MTSYVIAEKSDLSLKISKYFNAKLVIPQGKIFPDGEQKIILPRIKNKSKIFIIINSYPHLDSSIIKSFLLISKFQEKSNKITLIIPYLPYARQDKEFRSGEIITSKTIANLYNKLRLEKILVVDIHSNIVLNFFRKICNVSAINIISDYCSKMKFGNPVIVAPDLFWKNHAEMLAKSLKTESFALNKFRNRDTGELTILPSKTIPIKHRNIILFDDMISTGNSMIKAANYCKNMGCAKIIAVCTHGILVNDAQKKMKRAGISEIIYTNTINSDKYSIDISKAIIENLE